MIKKSIARKCATVCLSLGTGLVATYALQAQNNSERSPYSRFGYGSLSRPTTAGTRGMGGVVYGVRDANLVNPSNPASYTAVDSMTFIFDVGISAGLSILSESGVSDRKYMGNLDYLTMLFPLGKKMAMSAGFMPFARTGYQFGSVQGLGGDANDQSYQRSYSGSGGYNQIYLGIGASPLQGFSLGANISYIVGERNLERQNRIVSSTASYAVHSEGLRLSGFKFDIGAQYEMQIDSVGNKTLTLGASVTPPTKLNSEYSLLKRTVVTSGSLSGTSEITQNDTITTGDYSLPLSLGFGASYRIAGKLMLGLDAQYSRWKDAKFENLEAQFQDQWRIALGGEYTPNQRARSVWKRSKYRAGLSGGNSYLQVPIQRGAFAGYYELGASVGIGLPLVDRRSYINFSIEYKHLRPKQSNMVREQYIGATIGIVFNEGWFRKARVN